MSKTWEASLLSKDATMQDAIKTLNTSTIKLVCLVDSNFKLAGVITDGDIRRAIVAGKTLESSVSEFMCFTPITFRASDTKAKRRKTFEAHKLLYIPVIDEQSKVINIDISQSISVFAQSNTVFLMAGGYGTRLRPLTEVCPKPLLTVGSKPILETIIDSFVHYGFHEFKISVHYLAEQIKGHFKNGEQFGVDIDYVEESSPLGTAGALSLLPMQDKPLILMNGDLLTKVDFRELLAYHVSEKAKVTMCVREYEYQVPYGVIQADNNEVKQVIEKPVEKYFVNAGIYVISPEVVNRLEKGSYKDMPDLINECLAHNEKVAMFPIHEYWLDIGRMADFERAQIDFMHNF